MKSDLLKGIVIISAVALSSCSVTNKMAGTRNTGDDDVYYTKAQAGDRIEYADANNYQQNTNDDYYYYGDYASRINRFSYNSPFDYDDEFYYTYVPYNNGFGLGDNLDQSYYYGNSKADTLSTVSAMYSPFNDGYLPYYDMGGYDDIGYGYLYSDYLFGDGGGGGWSYSRHHAHSGYIGSSSSKSGSSGSPLTFRRGAPNSSNGQIYYPGRPIAATSGRNISIASYQNNQRAVRTETQNVRPAVQQTFSNTPAQSSAPASSSSSSSSSSSGGGGRPVR